MFQLYIARGFRAGINQTRSVAIRDGRLSTNACRRLPLKNQEHFFHATRRSFLNAAIKVQSSSSQPLCSARCFSTSSTHLSDNDGNLVYTGSLGNAVRGVKFFSYSSSAFSLCMMPYVLMKTGIALKTVAVAASCSVVAILTFITPVALHYITKGYVVRLYHNADMDTYTAVTYSMFLVEKRTVFHQSDVKIPNVSRMFSTFSAGKMPMLVNPDLFHLPHDYNHLMGYDKPFSFDMDDLDKPEKS